MTQWREFTGTAEGGSAQADRPLPPPPPWRDFADPNRDRIRGQTLRPSSQAIKMINIALYLRRPLLITGKPGTGKSSLAYAVARELDLGLVLHWPINTRSSLQDGLYRYDAIARLRDAQINKERFIDIPSEMQDIARYIRLGPLGTALLPQPQPRVLLIDEIDKSDIDLPNDLLNVFEEGSFLIPELTRQRLEARPTPAEHSASIVTRVMADDDTVASISDGRVRCHEFPLVIMTSNKERDFPPAFLRRCLRLELAPPGPIELAAIVQSHFAHMLDPMQLQQLGDIIADFDQRRKTAKDDLATDQLLNLIFLLTQDIELTHEIKASVLQSLSAGF